MNTQKMSALKLSLAVAAAFAAMQTGNTFAGGPARPPDTKAADAPASMHDMTDRIIVRYRDNASARRNADAASIAGEQFHAAANRRGLMASKVRTTGQGAEVWSMNRRMSAAEAHDLVKTLAADNLEVEYAEPDAIMRPMLTPNDTEFNRQWSLLDNATGISATTAWNKTTGASSVVAILDTGYRPHADLAANVVVGYDFVSRDADPLDPGDFCGEKPSTWHGTHVSGIVAAVGNNSAGVAGVAYGAKVIQVRVLGTCGGYTSDVADGILWASGNTVAGVPANPTPARILNMSFGGGGACSTTLANAINAAKARGVIAVAAAGNSASDASAFAPANCAGVFTVAASNQVGGRSTYSNYGSVIALAAPGDAILSTLNTGATVPGTDNYVEYNGTSMAAPHVAGAAALMLSVNPSLTNQSLEALLRSTAKSFPASCVGCGTGIVNANAAVDASIAYMKTTVSPTSINKSRTGIGALSATATVNIINGLAPYTYAWTATGSLSLSNVTSQTVTVSEYFEVCGSIPSQSVSGTLSALITDALGRTTQNSLPVKLTAYAKQPPQICP